MLPLLMFLQTVSYADKLIDALIAMGPGGILAAIVFHFYRQDRQASQPVCSNLYSQHLDHKSGAQLKYSHYQDILGQLSASPDSRYLSAVGLQLPGKLQKNWD